MALKRSRRPEFCRAIDSPCECEHNNPDSLDARLFPSVVLAAAPAVTMDEASTLLRARLTSPVDIGGGGLAFTRDCHYQFE